MKDRLRMNLLENIGGGAHQRAQERTNAFRYTISVTTNLPLKAQFLARNVDG